MSIGEFEIGKTSSFTPRKRDTWIYEFNKLLNASDKSKNELISELIQKGLQGTRGTTVNIPIDNLSAEQVELLHTQEGQKILSNIIKMMLGTGEFLPINTKYLHNKHEQEDKDNNKSEHLETKNTSLKPEPPVQQEQKSKSTIPAPIKQLEQQEVRVTVSSKDNTTQKRTALNSAMSLRHKTKVNI